VVWFGNLPPPFIVNGGARLNGEVRFPNQTNTTYLNKKTNI
jgi:hypothetical protein